MRWAQGSLFGASPRPFLLLFETNRPEQPVYSVDFITR